MPCKHYKYNHKIFLKCCNKYYDCIYCHNQENDHYVKPSNVTKIKCLKCNTIQSSTQKCINCDYEFSKYFCSKCNYYNNKEIHHCDKCNLCYIKNKNDELQCNNCNDSMNEKQCQICLEDIKNSNQKYYKLNCNHIIHKECYKQYKKYSINNNKIFNCTICRKTIKKDLDEERFDYIINNNIFLTNWKSNILCYDCYEESDIDYHPNYLKCLKCNSYNTNQIKIIKST